MAKKKEAPVEREEMDIDHKEPRVYELGFHIDPELSQEEVKKTYEGIRTKIASFGTVIAEGEPQKIQLAYTVFKKETGARRDFDTSFFAWIAYETTGEGHEKVGEIVRGESKVFRFLDIRSSKEEAQHSAQLHEVMQKVANAKEEEAAALEEEEVSDVEIDQALKEVEV